MDGYGNYAHRSYFLLRLLTIIDYGSAPKSGIVRSCGVMEIVCKSNPITYPCTPNPLCFRLGWLFFCQPIPFSLKSCQPIKPSGRIPPCMRNSEGNLPIRLNSYFSHCHTRYFTNFVTDGFEPMKVQSYLRIWNLPFALFALLHNWRYRSMQECTVCIGVISDFFSVDDNYTTLAFST